MVLVQKFIDLIFPRQCQVCRKFLGEEENTGYFCRECLCAFTDIGPPYCPVCGRPYAGGISENHVCENCLRKRPFFESIKAPYLYEGGLMEAIHQFKYNRKSYLADSLGPLLAAFALKHLPEAGKGALIMPVPLHPKRLRERGFNQSLLLARHVVDASGTDLDFLNLRRIRHTQPQTGLNGDERRKNVRRAFEIRNPKKIKGRIVILVDDVITTGSTINECARILKRAGAERVLGLALASTKH